MKYKTNTKNTNSNSRANKNKGNNIYMVVPYTRGLNGNYMNICNKHEKQIHFKGINTLKNHLVDTKIKTP